MGNHQSQPQNTPQKRSQLQHPAQLSIIIPALNEQNCISQAILSTKVGGAVTQPEVIVVDGGSKDCTRTVAASHAGVQVLSVAEGGRGLQLNKGVLELSDLNNIIDIRDTKPLNCTLSCTPFLVFGFEANSSCRSPLHMHEGAEHTRKDWVLFMHADCKLPKGYFESMRTALDDGGSSGEPREWGCFCTLDTGVPSMKLVQWGIRMRTYIRGQPYGDQGLFCSSRAFQEAKFQRWPFLEDLQWVARMNRLHGRPAIADKPIQASPRRWLHYGILQTTCLNQLVLAGYSLGIPVQTLHWFYNSARSQYTSK